MSCRCAAAREVPVDECLPPSLAVQLSVAGHDAVSVVGLGLAGSADVGVMAAARDQERVLVSAVSGHEILNADGQVLER